MIQLADATVLVNDEVVAIMPNSLKITEGLGEQSVKAASIGGGAVEQIFARDVETAIGKVMFDVPTTPETVALQRTWKVNGNQNVVQIAGSTIEGTLTRTYTQAAMIGDPEIEFSTEGVINIEFAANQAI